MSLYRPLPCRDGMIKQTSPMKTRRIRRDFSKVVIQR